MIPVTLELYNFLAYRSPGTIDLSGLHLACLTGANGAGKSSLLDAITWVLWGKARGRRDDDLIHGDEEEMQVTLTFLLEGNTYRVMRYRTRRGRGNTLLALDIKDGEDWRAMAETGIRATQDRITRLLRLDYDTFINSAFLMQGRADEFTQKTPSERKAILGEILGLSVWARYEERAKQHLREIERENQRIELDLERIDTELQREADYLKELDSARQEMAGLADQVSEAEGKVRQLVELQRRQETVQERLADLTSRIGRDIAGIERDRADRDTLDRSREGTQAILDRQAEVEEGYRRLLDAREEEQQFGERLSAQGSLHQQLNDLLRAIGVAQNKLEAELAMLRRSRADRQRMVEEGAEKTTSLEEVQGQLADFEERQAERDDWTSEMSELNALKAGLEATNRGHKSKMEALKTQRDQIEETTEAVCPLCRQPLSDEHRGELLARLIEEGTQEAEAFRANQEQLHALESDMAQLEREIRRATSELRNLPPLQKHAAQLQQQIEQANSARSELSQLDDQIMAVEAALSGQAFEQEARLQADGIRAELEAVGYDEAAHQQRRKEIRALQQYEGLKSELDHVLRTLPDVEARIARLDHQINEAEAHIAEDRARIETLNAEQDELAQHIAGLKEWEGYLSDLRDQQGRVQYRVGAAQQKLHSLEEQRRRREALILEQTALAEERSVYEELRTAFGKDGVPAMLIEASIPEIENEANELLSRMTDGRMHVRFDTQREKVTGGVKETLDILIADELGTRDYGTFSGGEAFRVNFAIRLALSKLLARRAGAQLRTLVIDEGFGTQDSSGRERLVQAINAIKDDFDLILVITHIEELKEAFPVRIEITKTGSGSQVEIV